MRVGVEVGGTFTDLVAIEDGNVQVAKVPSVPARPDEGATASLAAGQIDLGAVEELVHGSTVATNAILERKGARVALLITRGFRDLLFLQRHNRTRIYDLFYKKPEPVVARRMGADARALMVADTGFNPYASALIATEATVRDHPDLVAAVVAASRQGWAQYLETPLATNQHIHTLNPEMDMAILAAGVDLSQDLVLDAVAGQHGIGHMSHRRWARLLEQMVEAGVVEAGQVAVDECYTVSFLVKSL